MPNTPNFEISVLESVDPEFMDALHRIIPQLSPESELPTREHLETVIACRSNSLFAARVNNQTVGTLTLTMLTIPTGISGWIADVVVDDNVRGHGLGEKLMRKAIEVARAKGAKYVDLSSRPARQAANRLYVRIGFQKRETNYYRFTL